MKDNRGRRLLGFIARVLIILFVQVVSLAIMDWVLSGLQVDGVWTAIVAVSVIALLNALLWPLLSYIILPFAVLTLGLASLVLNGALILLASALVDGFAVNNLWTGVLLTVGLTALNAILGSLLSIDDDSTWYRNVLRRHMRRSKDVTETDEPGFLFLEFDGLARPILEQAIAEGYTPTLRRWLETDSHRLVGWETDLSSQTSASQAGILHGNNDNIPAFRWYDRAAKEIVSSSNPRLLPRLEQALSDGNGLLVEDGASRGNMFSGDAPHVMNTASTLLDRSRFHTADFGAFFLYPYNFSRTLLLTIWDIILEIRQFRKARRNHVYPLLDKEHRGGIYPLLRAATTVLMRELNFYTLLGDMYASVPAAYATFVGYDEVAHHSGVDSEDAFDVLSKLDKQLGRLETAVHEAPRPYHLVILSDHGQTGGATFKQRYGLTLEDLVRQLARDMYRVQGDVDVHEDWGHVNIMLTEAVQYGQGAVSKPLGRVLKGRSQEGRVALGPEGLAQPQSGQAAEETVDWEPGSTIVVLASGNLGLVYGTRMPERATLEQIEEYYPGVLDGLAQHEGVGFVMAHSEMDGPVVIGGSGRHYLNDGRLEGEDPLANFGPNAALHLLRYDRFPDAPDLYISSFYDPDTGEGAAFEEQIGFHGGLGGPQTQPFLLFPSNLPLADEPLVGAAAVHRVLKAWVRNGNRSVGPDRGGAAS
ncbi:MAG: phage holin family protein [Anaerolineae bacterium]|jgi:putative membrane protein